MTGRAKTMMFVLSVLILFPSGEAQADNEICIFGETWANYDSVPVYLHPDVPGNLLHSSDPSSNWTVGEVEAEIRWALDRVHDSYADIPNFYYAGLSQCPSGARCTFPGAVHIQLVEAPTNADEAAVCSGFAAYHGHVDGLIDPGRTINLNRSALSGFPALCSIFWTHWAKVGTLPPRTATLTGILVHEMLHVLGLSHLRDCGTEQCFDSLTCSVAEINALESREGHSYFLYDVLAIQSRYGLSYPTSSDHLESNGPSWWSLGPWSSVPPLTHGADATVSQDNYMYVGWSDPAAFQPTIMKWEWWGISWTGYGVAPVTDVLHRIGVAYDGSTVYTHFLDGESEVFVTKYAAEYILPSGPLTADVLTTRRHGLESSVDTISGPLRVLTYRASDGAILLQLVTDDPSPVFHAPITIKDLADNDVIAYETPSVACADDYGILNCIVVWATAAEAGTPGDPHFHTLAWVHFNPLLSGGFEFEDVRFSPYVVDGPPRVTYRRDSSGTTAEFVVAYPQKNGEITQLVTLSKGIDPAIPNWIVTGVHDYYNERKVFALGSALWDSELVFRRW